MVILFYVDFAYSTSYQEDHVGFCLTILTNNLDGNDQVYPYYKDHAINCAVQSTFNFLCNNTNFTDS